jgi:acyl-CoA reductase-like NAD-dependent aldehyde dehydrogenase
MRRSPGETMPLTSPGQFGFTVRRPLGVIAGIAPFNAPFLLAMKKVVMALAAGNGFVLKPSELTPVTGLKIAEVFNDAVNKGAKLLCGKTHKDQYYWPTVLSGITPDMKIFYEESFGPVTSIIKVKSAEEALEIANNTDYGLSAGVITNDMQKALDLAFGLESGMVHLNDCTVADEPHVPFGGVKNSGFGREGGRFSMEEMTEVKWITMQRGQRAFPM